MRRSSAQRQGWLAAAGATALLAISAAPAAAAPYEPNETQATATGPLIAGAVYEAAIERLADADTQTPEDVDWYRFHTGAAGRVDVAYTLLQRNPACFGPEARLFDGAGTLLGTAQPARNRTQHIVHNGTGPDTYFLRVRPYHIEPCIPPDEPYSFDVQAPAALVTPAGQQPVRPVSATGRRRVSPRLTVSSARLRRGRLTVTGKLARGASARRIAVTVRRKLGRRTASFRMSAKAARRGRWRASRLLPRRLRSATSLRYLVTYRGDSRFAARTLPSKLVRRSRR